MKTERKRDKSVFVLFFLRLVFYIKRPVTKNPGMNTINQKNEITGVTV